MKRVSQNAHLFILTQGIVLILLLSMVSLTARAALHLELTQGVDAAIPAAIVPFTGEGEMGKSLSQIVSNDLNNSGRFKVYPTRKIHQFPRNSQEVDPEYWQNAKVDYLVIGQVKSKTIGRSTVKFDILSVYKSGDENENNVLASKEITFSNNDLRRVSHKVADELFQQLTNVKGIFSTRIAYVLVERQRNKKPQYSLQVADADGFNPRPLLISKEPIMSPNWSPNGKYIAYVSFEKRRASVFISDVKNGKRQLVSSFPGINGAPAWSPDGKKLAIVLSKTGQPKIYIYDRLTKQLTQLTHGCFIDTEPKFSPDGQTLLFTSNRGGKPQIYEMNLANGHVDRMTYSGDYNASASYAPNGESIALLHRNKHFFNIAIMDLKSGTIQELTRSRQDESPSLAPNGEMIVYASRYAGKGVLGLVSTDGKVKLRIPAPEGDVQEPVWSPFLS